MTDNNSNYNEKRLFPVDLLNDNWPFSFNLAEELVKYNGSHYCSSLKTFLLNTAIREDSDQESDSDTEISADSDQESDSDYIENGNLADNNFSFKNKKVYYYYVPPGVDETWVLRLLAKPAGTMYCMDNVSYDNLMYEAIKFFMKDNIEESPFKDNLGALQIVTVQLLWSPLSKLLLYTRYSSFVKDLIEDKKCMEKFQVELMLCSYRIMEKTIEREDFYTFFLSEKMISPRDRLLNLLYFSTLSREDRETFVDNFFKRNNFEEIISYYEEALSDSGYLKKKNHT